MEEQANLLPGVATAHDLMHRVVDLQGRINQLTTQFATKTEKKTKRHPVLYVNCLPFLGHKKWEAFLWLETLCTTSG